MVDFIEVYSQKIRKCKRQRQSVQTDKRVRERVSKIGEEREKLRERERDRERERMGERESKRMIKHCCYLNIQQC